MQKDINVKISSILQRQKNETIRKRLENNFPQLETAKKLIFLNRKPFKNRKKFKNIFFRNVA